MSKKIEETGRLAETALRLLSWTKLVLAVDGLSRQRGFHAKKAVG